MARSGKNLLQLYAKGILSKWKDVHVDLKKSFAVIRCSDQRFAGNLGPVFEIAVPGPRLSNHVTEAIDDFLQISGNNPVCLLWIWHDDCKKGAMEVQAKSDKNSHSQEQAKTAFKEIVRMFSDEIKDGKLAFVLAHAYHPEKGLPVGLELDLVYTNNVLEQGGFPIIPLPH